MCMSNLYVVEFDNGDKMTGSISQVYAAQEVNGCAVTLHPYIEVRKAPAPIAQDDGTMTVTRCLFRRCRIRESGGRLPGHISGCLTRLTHVTSC